MKTHKVDYKLQGKVRKYVEYLHEEGINKQNTSDTALY